MRSFGVRGIWDLGYACERNTCIDTTIALSLIDHVFVFLTLHLDDTGKAGTMYR